MTLQPDAEKVARYLCENSRDGCPGSEQFLVADMQAFLGMSDTEIETAIADLEAARLIAAPKELGGATPSVVLAEWELFFTMDEAVNGWNLIDDAVRVARAVEVSPTGNVKSQELASDLGWDQRRLNPATHHLMEQGAVDARSPMTKRAFYYPNLARTPDTRRFLRDHP